MKRRSKGEGSIYFHEKKQLWVAQLNLENGKTKTKYGKTQKEVRDWLHTQREAVKKGTFVEEDKVTVKSFLSSYMENVAAHSLRPKTIESYEYLIRLHINPALGDVRLTQLRPDMLQRLYSEKIESGLSKRTVQYIHAVLHKTLDQALKWGLVSRNITDLVEPPRSSKRTPTIWTIDQAKKFLSHTETSRFKVLYRLAFLGLREGEILGLQIEDFDLVEHTLYIRHALQYLVGKGLVLNEPKTEMGKRKIKLPDFAYQALKEHRDTLKENQGFMFTTSSGTPFSPRNFFRDFKDQISECDLPDIRFHDLRHTAISFMIGHLHIPPSIVQSYVGHASPVLTLGIYTHVSTEMQTGAVDKMSGLFNLVESEKLG